MKFIHVSAAALDVAPRLIAIDVDKTLLDDDHRLSEATIESVRRVRERGVEVLLASSRPPPAMWPYLDSLGLWAPASFVACQGAVTARYSPDGMLMVTHRDTVPLEAARNVAALAADAGVALGWYAGERWLVSRLDDGVEREAGIVGLNPEVVDLARELIAPDKLLVIAPPERSDIVRELTERLPPGVVAQTSNATYLEITGTGVDKGAAVERFALARGIPSWQVVAIGDGHNDLGMFAYAGTSVAPANARSEVLRAATYLTESNAADGVALALRHLVP